ncbi:methylated-DNA--[protein]-cysteine S-methyltransferase [Fictibacillus phosphorivorans]|uniref:methylated-DNA--[protein]-cysteine S-methyltransferase n=1 Tax=Fictibacillus phosphorivorans TaxID=1221500 RepID=UPI00203B3FF1|nr:methylated-DNA--[protein]-cysteine S-methyltransferase [Fictibacillus phosphorivorans]MCM3719037.1 methylated-DNA--[protein]-cysteine S-methyltransferase [Fictibacillus phosphorivorans]MCM3776659.1 methylated-DNA--[protein]-cysteine S-methyltransferase [Fictibacillus phosphorivorans]
MNQAFKLDYQSPIGVIEIISSEERIQSIMFVDRNVMEHQPDIPKLLRDCYNQLDEYFKGERQQFILPYEQKGTLFQQSVWNELIKIPFAETVSYRDIACSLQNEKAIRAVGSANGKNRLSIIIPCHRIIGSNGTLTGYAGGLWRKEWLLNHEKELKKLL